MDKFARDENSHSPRPLWAAASAILLTGMAGLAQSAPGDTELISVRIDSPEAAGGSIRTALSANGRYVAFSSQGSPLVPGDTNPLHLYDVFVRDRQSEITELVSQSTSGVQGNADSFLMSISADGRYVAFASEADNLVQGDTNSREDVFVRDRQSGLTERVSVDSNGVQGNDRSLGGSLSADGRYVAFASVATNLVSEGRAGDCYVKDLETGSIERVNVSSSGTLPSHGCGAPLISANGRFVAFSSRAYNLVPGDRNRTYDIFVRDLQTDRTEMVSLTAAGAPRRAPPPQSVPMDDT